MSSKRILLINEKDDENLEELISTCLTHIAGWSVVSIPSTQKNLDTIFRLRPDIIILNAALNQFSKLSWTQRITIQNFKENTITQAIPIVLLIDTATWFTSRELQSLGIAKAIAKPFDPFKLILEINQILAETNITSYAH